MSGDAAEKDARFCLVCDVSLDLHSGPDTCDTAIRKAALIGMFYGASVWPTHVIPPGATS